MTDSRETCTVEQLQKTPFGNLVSSHGSGRHEILQVSLCVEGEESDISSVRISELTDR